MASSLPRYDIARILRLRQRITEDLDVIGFLFAEMTPKSFEHFIAALQQNLPRDIPEESLRESCDYLIGIELTELELWRLAWRLAGNLRSLRSGRPVLPWDGIPEDEWMPAQITRVDFGFNRRGDPGGVVTFQILGGSACPEETRKFWSLRYCYVLAPRLGFTKYSNSRYPFRSVYELFNFRLALKISGGSPQLKFSEVKVPSSARQWNQRYIRKRYREQKGFKCPKGWPAARPCFNCPAGQDQCPAAVRPVSLVKDYCSVCEQTSFFDQAFPGACLECRIRFLKEESRKGNYVQ